jgi:ubiquinone/menaquinone biosynthesis C-methylase UbiE
MTELQSAIPNAKHSEEWNHATGKRWLERHQAVDWQIASFGRPAMDRADIRPGQRILDIGCGCGETTLELARRVGASGSVMGVDISLMLIEAARQLAKESGLASVRFEAADAQTFPFDAESFDLAFSRFGIMFFDDPEAAFGNLRRAVRPGGRLGFLCWPSPRDNLFMTIPVEAASRHIAFPQSGDPNAPGPFAFADPSQVSRILSRSGFGEIAMDRVTEKVGGGTLDESAGMLLGFGVLDSVLETIDAKTRGAILADIRSALGRFESQGRVLLDAVAWLVAARAV